MKFKKFCSNLVLENRLIKKDKKSISSSLNKYKYSIQKWINNKVCIPPSYRFIDIYEVTSN